MLLDKREGIQTIMKTLVLLSKYMIAGVIAGELVCLISKNAQLVFQ